MGFPAFCVEVEPTMAPKNKNVGKPRNYALESGVYRFGKSKTYHKKAVYKFIKKKTAKKAVKPAPTFVEKQINGAKNGGKRMVRVKRLRNDVPTMDKAPKGKRVIVLKQSASGLVLVTGPLKLNGCPMRRINQRYLLATKTSVDVSAVKLPENINDDYFKHAKAPKAKKTEGGDIFAAKKEQYKVSDARKADQETVDKQVLDAIKKHPEGASLKAYMKAIFSLSKGQFPHTMAF